MSELKRIITEEINKAIFNNQINKAEKLLRDLSTIDFTPYGTQIGNFAQKLNNLGWYVVKIARGDTKVNTNINRNSGYRGRFFNPYGFSNTLRKLGFEIPNEGLGDNVYSNSVNTYNWLQDKQQKLLGAVQGSNSNNEKQQINNIRKYMRSNWPKLFKEYATLVGRYGPALKKLPTLTLLVEELDQIYQHLKK